MPVGVGVPLNLPKRSNVVAMWSYEGDGKADRSGYGHHINVFSGTPEACKIGTGVTERQWHGGNTQGTYTFGTSDWTFCCWIATGNNGGQTGFFAMAGQTCYFYKDYSNNLQGNDGGHGIGLGAIGYDRAWNHVAVVKSSGNAQVYRGGSAYGGAQTFDTSLANGQFTPMWGGPAMEGWSYYQDEMIVWNVALTAGEISTIYGLTSYVNPPLDSGVIYF